MNFSSLKQHALASLRPSWGKALWVMVIIFLASFVSIIVEVKLSGGFIQWATEKRPPNVMVISMIMSLLLIPLSVGYMWYFLDVSRGKKPEVFDTFSLYRKFSTFFKFIGASFVQVFFVLCWMLLLIVPGIIKAFSYSQTFYILKDHPEMGILEAITESRKRMNGFKMDFFLLNLSFIGWLLLCIPTFGLALFYVMPYLLTTQGAFYDQHIANQQ